MLIGKTVGFVPHDVQTFSVRATQRRSCQQTNEEILREIQSIAQGLWKGDDIIIPTQASTENSPHVQPLEGEAKLGEGTSIAQRAEYFKREALKGCPKSQHSTGLLLWTGFAGVEEDAVASAKFHAAAASQNHLDAMAVLGGCLRKGVGVKRNVALGLKIIAFCASEGNPTGINKQAALLEENHDDVGAVKLYEKALEQNRVNALLLFNLGWCLVNGQGVKKKDVERGISLWKEAVSLAPDGGSEEAAWFLYEEYIRDDPKEAKKWLDIAIELGYKY